jgi:hypothetical protein
MVAAALVALALIAQAEAGGAEPAGPAANAPATPAANAPTAPPADAAAAPPASAAAPGPPPETPAPPPPPSPAPQPNLQAPAPPRRYGDKGSIELGLGLTYSSEAGFAAAASARYYVVDGVAPGVESTFVAGGTAASRYGVLLGALRVVPLRVSSIALAVTGRAGRVFVGDHVDGWGLGGAASVLFLFSPTVGLELGYEFLRLLPATFCADLDGCVIRGPIIAVRFGF